MQATCDKMLPCGHPCCGFSGETKCLPCLQPECIEKMSKEDAPLSNIDDFCSICFTEGLGQQPCVRLGCRHIFHIDCLKERIKSQWNGPRIIFNYLDCPECKARIDVPHCKPINDLMRKESKFEDVVVKKAIERAKFEDLHKHERVNKPGDRFYNDLKGFALYKLSYY